MRTEADPRSQPAPLVLACLGVALVAGSLAVVAGESRWSGCADVQAAVRQAVFD